MTSMEPDQVQLRRIVMDTMLAPDFRRASFGGRVRRAAPTPWLRVVVRPIDLRDQRHLQFSYFDATKHIAKNIREEGIASRLDEVLDLGFAHVHLATLREETDIRITKKGKVLISRRKVESAELEIPQSHNRTKDVPLPEGKANRLLEIGWPQSPPIA